MKTITLNEDAYERLISWKNNQKESFSSVVLKVVPRRGTLAELSSEIDNLPPLTEQQADTMQKTMEWANDWRNRKDPWTS